MIAHLRGALSVGIAIILLFNLPALSDEKKPLTFTATARGELNDASATKAGFRTRLFDYAHIAFTNYDASDGEKVMVYHGEFRSDKEARRYFDWMLKKDATQALKQQDKIDRDGKIVGRRAEYLLQPSDKEKEWIIMFTEGEQFLLISAPTLECAQEFERQATESESAK